MLPLRAPDVVHEALRGAPGRECSGRAECSRKPGHVSRPRPLLRHVVPDVWQCLPCSGIKNSKRPQLLEEPARRPRVDLRKRSGHVGQCELRTGGVVRAAGKMPELSHVQRDSSRGLWRERWQD